MIPGNEPYLMQLLEKDPAKRDTNEVKIIAAYVGSLKFIQKIKEETNDETVFELSRHITAEYFPQGKFVFKEGERGDKFYIILQGTVAFYVTVKKIDEDKQVFENQLKVGASGAGAAFGELALLQDKPRAASVFCETDCAFGVLTKKEYNRGIGRFSNRELQAKISFLNSLPTFSSWQFHNIAKLTYYIKDEPYIMNKIVFREGDPTHSIFIVRKGEFQLIQTLKSIEPSRPQRKRFNKIHIATLGEGELIGVNELIEKTPYVYTCICSTRSGLLLTLSVEDFTRRVLSGSYSTLRDITQLKKIDYVQRAKNMKVLTLEPVQLKSTEGTPKQDLSSIKIRMARTNKLARKPLGLQIDIPPPRYNSLERTMTNLIQRPDTFTVLRSKLRTATTPKRRRSKQTPCNMHMEAIRANANSYYRSKAYGPFLALERFNLQSSTSLDLSTLVRSLEIPGSSLNKTLTH